MIKYTYNCTDKLGQCGLELRLGGTFSRNQGQS